MSQKIIVANLITLFSKLKCSKCIAQIKISLGYGCKQLSEFQL